MNFIHHFQAASSGAFLDGCLDMLIRNFTPPPKLQDSLSVDEWAARKKDIFECVLSTLQHITDLIPLVPMRLWPKIVREMPKSFRQKVYKTLFLNFNLSYCRLISYV